MLRGFALTHQLLGAGSVALTHGWDEQDALIPRDRAHQQVDIPAHIMTLQTPYSNQLHEAKSASRWPSPQPLGTPAPIGPKKHSRAATDRSLEPTTDPGGPQPGWAPVPNAGSRPGRVSPCITEQQQGHKAGRRQLTKPRQRCLQQPPHLSPSRHRGLSPPGAQEASPALLPALNKEPTSHSPTKPTNRRHHLADEHEEHA